jgi:hypothetical protein
VDIDGNFRKRVEFKGVNGKLSISLEIGVYRRLDISGSPFSIEKELRLKVWTPISARRVTGKGKGSTMAS